MGGLQKKNKKLQEQLLIFNQNIKNKKQPPVTEQHRISDKVEELFAIFDALNERINESQVTHLNLADALVDWAVG